MEESSPSAGFSVIVCSRRGTKHRRPLYLPLHESWYALQILYLARISAELLATEQVKAHARSGSRHYVEPDHICLLDGPPPSKRARYSVRPSTTPESPVKTETDIRNQAQLDELFEQRNALNAKLRSLEAEIRSLDQTGEVSQLLPFLLLLAESLFFTLLAE